MSSSRFPKKSLKKIGDFTLIRFIFNQVTRSKLIENIIVVTSTDISDDELCQELDEHSIPYFRGSLEDVLDRFYRALDVGQYPDYVVRVTGDCPFISSELIDIGLNKIIGENLDYVSNVCPPTFPDGLDFECFSFQKLKEAWLNALHKDDREHVTPYIRRSVKCDKKFNLKNDVDLSNLRWTIDYEDDYEYILKIFDALKNEQVIKIDKEEILRVINKYQLVQPVHERNEKYLGI